MKLYRVYQALRDSGNFRARLFTAFIALQAVACVSQSGLKTPGVDRWCDGDICYIRASQEQVNARCTSYQVKEPGDRFPAWRSVIIKWDNGAECDPKKMTCANACTIATPGRRLRVWFHDFASIIHEECHAKIFRGDEFRYVVGHHTACDKFGPVGGKRNTGVKR